MLYSAYKYVQGIAYRLKYLRYPGSYAESKMVEVMLQQDGLRYVSLLELLVSMDHTVDGTNCTVFDPQIRECTVHCKFKVEFLVAT